MYHLLRKKAKIQNNSYATIYIKTWGQITHILPGSRNAVSCGNSMFKFFEEPLDWFPYQLSYFKLPSAMFPKFLHLLFLNICFLGF